MITHLDNINLLSPIGFKLSIDNASAKNLAYFCTAANLPGISRTGTEQGYRNHPAAFQGDTIEYTPLSVKFMVDEDMKNYFEMFDWIQSDEIKERDITLTILTNQSTKNHEIQFYSAFPTSLSELSFDLQNTSIEYLSATVEFKYTRFVYI